MRRMGRAVRGDRASREERPRSPLRRLGSHPPVARGCGRRQGRTGDPGGALSGPDFNARLSGPALAILSSGKELSLWGTKQGEVPEVQAAVARKILAAAAETVQGLAVKAAEAAFVGATDEDDVQYWQPLDTALGQAEDGLAILCPRMMNVRNAATTAGQAKDYLAIRCLVLTDNGKIKALAMRTISNTLQVHDITVEPRALQEKAKGLGSALMEYIVREAAARGLKVTLLPIGDIAKAIYATMGFAAPDQGGSDWEMTKPAQQKYLAKHQVFGGQFKPPS